MRNRAGVHRAEFVLRTYFFQNSLISIDIRGPCFYYYIDLIVMTYLTCKGPVKGQKGEKMDKNKAYPLSTWNWLIAVAQTPALYYGRIPVSDLYKVFHNGSDFVPAVSEIGEKEFSELLRAFLSMRNKPGVDGTPGAMAVGLTCRIVEDEAIILCDDQMAEELKKKKEKRALDHKILSYDEVMHLIEKGYIKTAGTDAMRDYLMVRWKKTETEADEIVRHMATGFLTGSDLATEINEFTSILMTGQPAAALTLDVLNDAARYLAVLHNSYGEMELFGWSPNELYKQVYGVEAPEPNPMSNGSLVDSLPRGARITPGSSHMAQKLKECEPYIRSKGMEIDLESTAGRYYGNVITPEGTAHRGRPVKVYPNDPCPCGSGKKFKNCHGR